MNWSNLPDSPIPPLAASSLAELQQGWLMQCLSHNKDTDYGQAHRFCMISSTADYQRQVPIADYESLQPSIEAMAEGKQNVLFSGKTLAFELTSGSTAAQKLIPYSAQSLEDFRRALLPWLLGLRRRFGITSGTAYWALSPASRQPRLTAGGIPLGLPDSAYLGEDLGEFFLRVSAVPFWVAGLHDFDHWQLATLYFLVRSADLSLISIWSPTFLSTLLDALNEHRQQLEQALTHGFTIDQHALVADPGARKRLHAYYQTDDPRILWPDLMLISCWADASSLPYYQALKSRFGTVPFQPKGLLSTEAVVTVPDHHGRTLLTPHSGFYEFIADDGAIHLAHDLQAEEEYQVILTTAGGLYRYRTGDRVRCLSYVGILPHLQFIGREQTSDLAGEKLSETFISDCLAEIEGFRMLLPLHDDPGYCLVLDTAAAGANIVDRVEHRLCRNPHYAYARKLGQLRPLKLLALDNPTAFYLEQARKRGTRLGDIKLPSLCLDPFPFIDHLERVI